MKLRSLGVLFLPALWACAQATGEVSGGEPRFDSGSAAFADADPQSWTALYRDLFGPSGHASCSGNNTCHGSAAQQGAKDSNGFVCGDKDGCLASLKAKNTGLIQEKDAMKPKSSGFYGVLRRKENGATLGIMPKSPAYVFTEEELGRIEAWMAKGSPND